eukprot:3133252-Pleurochrysis_carterae.AAC.1
MQRRIILQRETGCIVHSQVHDVKDLVLLLRFIPRDKLEDDALRPLVKVLDSVKQVVYDGFVDGHAALGREHFVEGTDAVGDDLRVAVSQHRVERVDDVRVFQRLGREEVQLHAAHHRRLSHVRAGVLRTLHAPRDSTASSQPHANDYSLLAHLEF